jgi:hypothetical protein
MKKRLYKESELDNAWKIDSDEEVVVRGKLRPAVIISSEREHRDRGCAHVLPLLRPTQWHLDHEAEIRRDGIPGLAWLDNVPIRRNAPESVVADCSRGVRPPMVHVERRERIALMDLETVKELRQLWADYLVFSNA